MKIITNGYGLATIYLDGKKSKYIVTTDGNIFNVKKRKFLKRKIDSKGYYHVILSHKGKAYDKRIHRLVAEAFIPNPENKPEVNHLDGNKLNPRMRNLEWATKSENMRHAVNTKLLVPKSCEDSGKAILTNDDVHEICKLMQLGETTQREISKIYNVDESVIHEIKLGNNWKDISKKYHIQNCKLGVVVLGESDVRRVCELIEFNYGPLKSIASHLDISYERVLDIYNHNTYGYISKDYNFNGYKYLLRYDTELKETIKSLMIDGYTNSEIIKITGIERSQKTNTLLYRMRKSI